MNDFSARRPRAPRQDIIQSIHNVGLLNFEFFEE